MEQYRYRMDRQLRELNAFAKHVSKNIERADRKNHLGKKIHLQRLFKLIEEDIEELEIRIEERDWKALEHILV